MTRTSPPSDRRAPRRLRRPGIRALSLGALALAAVLGIGAPLAASPAVAASTSAIRPSAATPTPEPTAGELTGEAVFTLAPVANGIVRADAGLAVSVALENGTDAETLPAAVTLSVGAEPLRDRAALTAWLAGDTTGVALSPAGSTAFDSVASGGEDTKGIVIAPGDPILDGRAPGVYPLSASYAASDGPIVSTSVMIVPPDGEAAVGIGVVVPITAGATPLGLLTATELIELTGPTGSLTNQLDAVEGTTAILAVDPAITAAIRVLGTSAPPTATDWLTRLLTLPNSRFALQFGDADVVAQAQAGLTGPLPALSLQAYMNAADFAPTTDATPAPGATPSPSPSASTDPDAPVYPSLEELLDIGGARPGIFWPATGTATPDTVASLGDVVREDRTSLTLVPSSSTSGAGGAAPGRAVAGGAELLVYDADVSRELHDASIALEPPLRGASLTAAAAFLAFAVADAGEGPVMVTVDRAEDRSRVGLRTAITSASQAPGVTPMTLAGAAMRLPVPVEIADATADQVRADAASALIADEAELARFATIVDDPMLLTGPQRAEILQVLGNAWLPDPAAWQSAFDLHRETTRATLDSVGILPPSPANLLTAGAPIPIWVRNDLPYPVNVVLYATPDDLRLDVAKATDVTAGPRSNTRVQVPVQARVGNGEVTVDLQLRSRTLEPIGAAQTVDVNVRADWEGVGIGVLSVLIGGFILLGLVRTVLRLRARRTRAGPAPDAAADGARDAAPAATDGVDRTGARDDEEGPR
ncbi:MAG TPA: DUF6049 family protein [Microbacterium sp.]|nr:DUF6049 family protein [Microbacterium sp.]